MIVTGNTFASVYRRSIELISSCPEFISSPRGMEIKEHLGLQLEITDTRNNLFTNEIRNIPLKYLANELILYFAGKYNVSSLSNEMSFGEASSFWNKIAKKDGTVNSAYGYLLFKHQAYEQQTQWQWVIDNLKKDKDSRQAIAHINRTFHQYNGNKDFVCTMSYHFFIRNNEVHLHVHRRSQDMVLGIIYDTPWELLLMQCLIEELRYTYPGLKLGSYKLFIGSAHIYQRDYDLINKMLHHDFINTRLFIDENPVLHDEIIKLANNKNYKYKEEDSFIQFLSKNR